MGRFHFAQSLNGEVRVGIRNDDTKPFLENTNMANPSKTAFGNAVETFESLVHHRNISVAELAHEALEESYRLANHGLTTGEHCRRVHVAAQSLRYLAQA